MRHRIVHEYPDVDPEIVWRVVTHELRPLLERLLPLIGRDDTP